MLNSLFLQMIIGKPQFFVDIIFQNLSVHQFDPVSGLNCQTGVENLG